MIDAPDHPNVVVHPPIAVAVALLCGVVLQRVLPLHFMPFGAANAWIGGAIFACGFALALWAVGAFREAGTEVPTFRPTSAIVAQGPYRYSRNPIYIAMFLGFAGLAAGFDTLWLLLAIAPFALVIRYGVVAREEAYLTRKFGADYLAYQAKVRRWL